MADRETVAAQQCVALGASGETLESFPNKEVKLGSLPVSRALPVRERRLVGPWCFLDRFGPLTFADEKPMDVAPHPHIGLQTVTWMLDGEIIHHDSLGSEAIVRPGGVNVMTSGGGISHTEQTPANNSGRLNGVQLWVALPDARRGGNALFENFTQVPALDLRGGVAHVFAGSLLGAASPARYFSDLLAADIEIHAGQTIEMEVDPSYEHAVVVLGGDCALGGNVLLADQLYYLGVHRSSLCMRSRSGGRLLLIGGPPFPEKILMWWNFVARTPEEIAQARADWEEQRRFGDVPAYQGQRLTAPSLIRFARPNPVS